MKTQSRLTQWIPTLCVVPLCGIAVAGQAADKKPNTLVVWGDDIGSHNISAYSLGVRGYKTPNIDGIAGEGALFTDAYSQRSCMAGHVSFVWLFPIL